VHHIGFIYKTNVRATQDLRSAALCPSTLYRNITLTDNIFLPSSTTVRRFGALKLVSLMWGVSFTLSLSCHFDIFLWFN